MAPPLIGTFLFPPIRRISYSSTNVWLYSNMNDRLPISGFHVAWYPRSADRQDTLVDRQAKTPRRTSTREEVQGRMG